MKKLHCFFLTLNLDLGVAFLTINKAIEKKNCNLILLDTSVPLHNCTENENFYLTQGLGITLHSLQVSPRQGDNPPSLKDLQIKLPVTFQNNDTESVEDDGKSLTTSHKSWRYGTEGPSIRASASSIGRRNR
jgi:hypothetical protein